MKIVTETGSVYNFDPNKIMFTKNGEVQFRAWDKFCFDDISDLTAEKVFALEENKRLPLQVGKRMCVWGKDGWYISTPIISIEKEEDDEDTSL